MTATPEAAELVETESPSKQWRGFARGARKGRGPSGPNDLKAAILFILPASIGFIAFFAFPAIRGFYLSLTNYNLIKVPKFIGLTNYQRLLQDPLRP